MNTNLIDLGQASVVGICKGEKFLLRKDEIETEFPFIFHKEGDKNFGHSGYHKTAQEAIHAFLLAHPGNKIKIYFSTIPLYVANLG